MRAPFLTKLSALLALTILLPASLPARTPQWVMGNSGDTWEKAPSGYEEELQRMLRQQPIELCQSVYENHVVLLTDETAVARLENASVVRLDDAAEQSLRDRVVPAGTTAKGLFAETLRQMEARRREALVERRGSWSRYEESEFQRVLALLNSDQNSNHGPYLVRAFRWKDQPTLIRVSVCGSFVRTQADVKDSFEPGRRPKPERAAAVVFLPSAPQESFPQWIADIIPVPADWDSAPAPTRAR